MDDMLKARLERAATMQGRYLELATKLGRPPTEDELNFFDHNGGHVFDNEVEEIEDSYRRDAEDWMHGKPLPPRSIKRSASFSPEIRSRIMKARDLDKDFQIAIEARSGAGKAHEKLWNESYSRLRNKLKEDPDLERRLNAAVIAHRKANARVDNLATLKRYEGKILGTGSSAGYGPNGGAGKPLYKSASFSPETRSRILKSANSIKKGNDLNSGDTVSAKTEARRDKDAEMAERAKNGEIFTYEDVYSDGDNIIPIKTIYTDEFGDPLHTFKLKVPKLEFPQAFSTDVFDIATEPKVSISDLRKQGLADQKKFIDESTKKYLTLYPKREKITKEMAIDLFMKSKDFEDALLNTGHNQRGGKWSRLGNTLSLTELEREAVKMYDQLPREIQQKYLDAAKGKDVQIPKFTYGLSLSDKTPIEGRIVELPEAKVELGSEFGPVVNGPREGAVINEEENPEQADEQDRFLEKLFEKYGR